jgi:ubiquinone/menaquinone biosynthesis C-methylase UbiE
MGALGGSRAVAAPDDWLRFREFANRFGSLLGNYMLDHWVINILAHPITKLPATPEQIGIDKNGVIDARIGMRNTIGFETWDAGQVAYEQWEKRTVADYTREIAGDAPVYEHVKMTGAILDVGGGHGAVREFIPATAQFVSVDPFIDIEQHIPAAKRSAYTCFSKPLNFIGACAEFLPFRAASFDWVHMRSMLDHVHSPDLAVMEAHRVLKPDGRMVIGLTVDGGKTGRRTFRRHTKELLRTILTSSGLRRFKDHHTFHPTFANLQKIIRDNGFEIEDVYWQPIWKDQVCYIIARPT